jgi:hypothetical protein
MPISLVVAGGGDKKHPEAGSLRSDFRVLEAV